MKKYRIAIVGTGLSVGNHLGAIEALADRLELVAAVDLNEARVKQICAENAIPRAYTDLAQMLATEQPDLVSVITPSETHKAISIQCLEAGAWVFCEKPLCASLAEFDEIRAAEARTGRYIATVFQWRFGSAVKHLRQLMQANAFGRPLVGVCNTLWYRDQSYYSGWHGKYKSEFGGPTLTLGIHLMDLFLYLMGDWQSVQANIATLDHDIEVEDLSMALVRFQNGALGSIINSALSPRQESYLRLDFQKATLEVSTLYRYGNEHWKISLPPKNEDPEVVKLWDTLNTDFQGSHEQQLIEVLDCMERSERPPVGGDEARRIIEFIASLYKSAHLGRPVAQGEITPEDDFYYANNGASGRINPL